MERVNTQKKWLYEKYVSYFFIYSFLGWIIEVTLFLFQTKDFVNRGFLHLPILPIYGFGAVLISLVYKDDDYHWFGIALVGGLIASGIELITSYFLEYVFKISLWDYGNLKWNFQGRISLLSSIMFMFGAVLIIKFLNPFIERKLRRFKYSLKLEILLGILSLVTLVDFVLSVMNRI